MSLEELIFAFIGLVVVLSASGMVFSRNTVYSALFLVLNFATVALLYLLLGAPFISMVQITVYAGAIMILFLFVIMMLGPEKMQEHAPFRGQRFLAIGLALVFLLEALLLMVYKGGNPNPLLIFSADDSSPQAIGIKLFSDYSLPFLITAFILVAAVIGAVALPRGSRQALTEENKPLIKEEE